MSLILPEEIERYRDERWRRLPELAVSEAASVEALVESLGFLASMTDSRHPGPSLYISVCGRRDAHMPRNVQKDPESSMTWNLKDEVMRRGRVYYAKLTRSRAAFVAPRLIPHFNSVWGVPRRKEKEVLSDEARAVLRVLRREWEMATADLREASGISDRPRFLKAMDELQKALKVIPSEVLYEPWFTYIWTLPEARFPELMAEKVARKAALGEIARAFLEGAGMTIRGELARVTGLSRPEAGLGNQALVSEGFAECVSNGEYRLADLDSRLESMSRSVSTRE